MTTLCDAPVCDTTVKTPVVPPTFVDNDCGLPVNGVWTHATIYTDGNGCITRIENGTPYILTPDPCCADSGTGTGGGSTGLDGPPGPAGDAATITIGAVNTLAPGSPVTVVNVGTNTHAILNISIPQGNDGADGSSPTGLTQTVAGLVVTNGLIQSLPSNWPPVMDFNAPSTTNNGVSLLMSKNASTGIATLTIDASAHENSVATRFATTNGNVTALTTQVNTLQTDLNAAEAALNTLQGLHDALQIAHNTLKARVDAAGIP